MMPLGMASIGDVNVIQKITGRDEVRQHLAELGFVVGETVTVVNELGGNMILAAQSVGVGSCCLGGLCRFLNAPEGAELLRRLADTVAGVAAWAGGRVCVTLDSSMQYLSPGRGKQITCTATPKKQGRTILVYDAALTDETGKLVAIGTYTFFVTQRQVEDTALACGGTAG